MDYVEIGCTPYEENCAQVGQDGYERAARIECTVFARMLRRLFPEAQASGVTFVVRGHEHDFGTYQQVAAKFDGSSLAALEAAYRIEDEAPARWDAIAAYELQWFTLQAEHYTAALQAGERDAVPPALRAGLPALDPAMSLTELLQAHPLR